MVQFVNPTWRVDDTGRLPQVAQQNLCDSLLSMQRHCRERCGHPTHTAKGKKNNNILTWCLICILYFCAMESYLFVKCYSHDTVVCAVDVWGCNLEHHWTETWEDSNQFQMEPNKPVAFVEAQEMRTDDGEGPVHYTISHNRLEIRDLSNYDKRGFKHHTVYVLQVTKYLIWMSPLQLM